MHGCTIIWRSLLAVIVGFGPYPYLDRPPTTFLFKVAGHTEAIRSGLNVFARDGTGVGLVMHTREPSSQSALNVILTETTRYLGAAPVFGPTVHGARLNTVTTSFRGHFGASAVRGNIMLRRYGSDDYIGLLVLDRPERFATSAPKLLRSVRIIEAIGPW
jgi:hypothetical protein